MGLREMLKDELLYYVFLMMVYVYRGVNIYDGDGIDI